MTSEEGIKLAAALERREGEKGRPPRSDAGLIVELYCQGVPSSVIAKTCGVRSEHIPRYVRRAGLPVSGKMKAPSYAGPQRGVSKAERIAASRLKASKVVELRAAGLTYARIAAEMGMSETHAQHLGRSVLLDQA